MNLDEAIQLALEGKAILFSGSGFSSGAKNILGEYTKTGSQFKDDICGLCGVPINNSYTLSTIAEYFISLNSEEALIDLLKKQFTVSQVSEHHEIILSVPWKRIYTTNYDNIIELSASKNGIWLESVTMSDNLYNYPKDKVCVHLNGYIDNLNPDTINNEFKLTDRSYEAESLRGKPWFDFMEKDFYSASAIIVIGFSMQYDLDIKRIISTPDIRKKIIFISKPGLDEVEKNTLIKYANIEEIGINGFAGKITDKKKDFIPPIQKMVFSAFLYEHMTPLIPSKPEFADIVKFYYHGENKDGFFERDNFGQYIYIINRSVTDIFFHKMNTHKVFLAVSGLGNGKTVLCDLVRNELRKQDIHVFTYERDTTDIDDEISYICLNHKKNKVVVIIDDYYKHFDILRRFREYGLTNIIFFLTARNSRNIMSYRKLVTALGIDESEICPLILDRINETEAKNLANVLQRNDMLHSKFTKINVPEIQDYFLRICHGQISSIVLDLFESSKIKKELTELFENCLEDESDDIQELAIVALASATMNLGLTLTDIINFLNIDYVILRMRESLIINELFDITLDDLKIKSSIISKSILYSIISPDKLITALIKIVFAADKTTSVNARNIEILKAIISHSNFIDYTKKHRGIPAIKKFYNDIRDTNFCQKSPFFWEQFASSCIDANEFDTAKQCLENAFVCAKTIPGFVPFQVETIYANYLVSKLYNDLAVAKLPSDTIISTVNEVSKHLLKYYNHAENNHFYIFKVWNTAVMIVSENIIDFTQRELSIVLETMIHMNGYYKVFKSEHGSSFYGQNSEWGTRINECIDKIKYRIKDINSKIK